MQFSRELLSLPLLGARAGVLAALLAITAPANAQDAAAPAAPAAPAAAADTSPQPEWVKLCSKPEGAEEQVCLITRERRATTGQLLAAVTVREVGDKKFMVAAVVPGMLIRPGMQVQIDGANATKAEYTICFPNLCFAEAEINADYVTKLKGGSKLVVTTLSQQAKPVNFDISLAGFTAAYDGAAIDPAELQAKTETLTKELERKAAATREELIQKQQQTTQ
jgi:invasion protein IalB